MQYIQLQGQVAADLDLPIEGSYNLFIDTSDNSIKAKDSDGHMHGGGGLSLTELTREELGQLVASASLTPGAFYKITGAASQSFLDANGFGYSGYGNEIQQGGTTIILQAATDSTLSKKGVGLFYVPNYENPQQLTAPPDYNYLTWDNTHRLYFTNVNGTLPIGANVTLYSDFTEVSTTATLEGSLEGSGSGNVTLRLGNNDTFFQNPDNLNALEISYGGITGYIDGYDYTSSYAPGDCVVYGGRVWQNLSGSIGWREGGNQWPTNALNLNPEDWVVVPFDEVHYTLQAHTIEYEFEYDNISYRSDGSNEVRCLWDWWNNNYGYNTIAYFPWGHYGVERVSFTNTYLHHFVNFPWLCEARDIRFEHNGLFNATTWGRQSYFNRIYGSRGAQFGGNRFSTNTDIWDISIGIEANMRNLRTTYGSEIYEITIGNNAGFEDIQMYNGANIYDVELGSQAYFGNSVHYEWTNVYNVNLDINSTLANFTLYTYSEIKDISIGVNSWIQYFDLAYSSCLKRTTIATDGNIGWFDIGVDSFIRQVNLSDRAYIENFTIGDNSNLQNINLGAYSYMSYFNGGQYTDFQNIRLDARAHINNIYLGYESTLAEIEIGPNSTFSGVDGAPFTSSYIGGISIQPHCTMNNITIGTNTYLQNIYVGNDSYFGQITLEESTTVSDINVLGDTESGTLIICSGSAIRNFQVGINSGFGEITVSSSAELTNFEIGNNSGFGGTTFSSSLSSVTIGRGFSNYLNTQLQDVNGNTDGAGRPYINIDNRSIVTIDISGVSGTQNWALPDGNYEGQEITFIVKTDGTHTIAPDQIQLWSDNIRLVGYGYNLSDYNGAIRPFARLNVTDGGATYIWKQMTKAVWTDGRWYSDAELYND